MEHEEASPALEYRASPELGELFAALAKAQGKIRNAAKDAANPHFKSKYADLASITDACRAQLSEAGIAVLQIPFNDGQDVGIVTRLGHASGQWIEGRIKVAPMKWDAQGLGSVVTYLRRYSLAAMAGVAPGDDDDGEAAAGRGSGNGTAQMGAPAGKTRKPTPPADPNVEKAREKFQALRNLIKSEKDADELDRIFDGHDGDLKFIEEHGGMEAAGTLARLYNERREFLRAGIAA